MLKSSKGITLVALVITIIVLLILAGVTISILFNDDIAGKAQTAVDTYKNAESNEQLQLDELQNRVNTLWNKYYKEPTSPANQ